MLRWLTVLLAAVISLGALPAQAQDKYPSKVVRIIVPLAQGGITDIAARLVAAKLTERLGQAFVVENRPGPGGMIGAEYVAKAAPDGYTIIMGTVSSHAINMSLYPNIRYNNLKDFQPIALVTTQANLLVVHPSVPANTLQEFIALLKANPGKYAFGSTGTGTSNHVATELFMMRTGTKMLHVPYKGSGPMIPALLSGEVSLAFDNMPTSLPQVQAGKLKGLGVTSPTRIPELPNVPAMVEIIPEFTVQSWQGLFAPAGTPPAIVELLAENVKAVLQQPDVIERIKGMGAQPGTVIGSKFTDFVRGETERWAEVVKASGAKAE